MVGETSSATMSKIGLRHHTFTEVGKAFQSSQDTNIGEMFQPSQDSKIGKMLLPSRNVGVEKAPRSSQKDDQLMKAFEEACSQTDVAVDPNAEPVCILAMDGVGLQGYSLIKILEAIHKKCKYIGSFCHQFDLVAGTSFGGVAALLMNELDTTEDIIAEGTDVLDECCRQKSFTKTTNINTLVKGKAGRSADKLRNVFESRYGAKEALYRPDGVPTFVLCASRSTGKNGNGAEDIHEPFLLRTYEYPTEDGNAHFELAKSSKSTSVVEAMTATSAIPGIVSRAKVNVDGEKQALADGLAYSNNLIILALNEARHLYPTRPIGCIISIGPGAGVNDNVTRAINIAQSSYPDLHYHRICPSKLFDKIEGTEKNVKKIVMMRKEVFDFVDDVDGADQLVDVSVKRVFELNQSRKKWQKEEFETSGQEEKEVFHDRGEVEEEEKEKRCCCCPRFFRKDYSTREDEEEEVPEPKEIKRDSIKTVTFADSERFEIRNISSRKLSIEVKERHLGVSYGIGGGLNGRSPFAYMS